MSQNTTYTKFYTPENAQFLISLLQQHNIPYSLEHEVNQLDKVYIGEAVEAMYALKIPGNRFNEVNALLAEQAKTDMAQAGFDHYLQSYSTEELREIIHDPNSWNAYDLQVATALYTEKTNRSIAVPITDINSFTPAKMETIWLFLGYLASVLAFTNFFFLGAAGFFSGLAIVQAKKILPNGTIVKMYTKKDNTHGRNMMFLSIFCTIAGAILFYIRIHM